MRSQTPLVGRVGAPMAVWRMLAEGARLVTLTGPPGVGKTRLANEIVTAVAAEMGEPLTIVSLDTVRDTGLIAPAIGQALGVSEVAGQPLAATLADYLRETRTVLVLDHVDRNAAPIVAALLTGSKQRMLATSREPLGIAGEHVYPVPPLDLPDVASIRAVTDLMNFGATRLFVACVHAAAPDHAIAGEGDARTIVEICTLLGGLPLAIEMAAARSGMLPLTELHEALRGALPAPPADPGDTAAFEQVLRATIAWSAGLLPPSEGRLFARLAIFVGGWTQEAASAVCDADALPVAMGLRTLCDLHLVQCTVGEDGDERFAMLEPVRAYAVAQLAASGDEAETWRRFVGYYRSLAEQTELMLRGPRQVRWLDRLEAELANLRAILQWAFDRGDAAAGLQLAGALDRFWQYHTHIAEGRQWLARGLRGGVGAPPAVRAKALSLAGWLARFQDALDESAALLTEALALYRSLDDRRGIAEVTDTLGDLAHFTGDQERARELHERNLTLRRELGDRWGVAMSLNSLGWIALAAGDDRRAVAVLQESLALVRQLGDGRGMAMVLTGLGWASLDRDDARQAQVCMRESLMLFRALGSKIDIYLCIEGLAAIAGMRGEPERAARLFGAAQALHDALHIENAPLTERHYARHREAARALVPADVWVAAWEAGRTLSLDQAVAEANDVGIADDSATPRME